MRVAVKLPLQLWYISLPQLLQTAGYSYRCVISSTGIELMATVDANSSVTCQLPVNGIAITETESVARVELQWRNGTNTFDIETNSTEQQSRCYQYGHMVMIEVSMICMHILCTYVV